MPCNVARDALTWILLPKSFWKGGVCQELDYLVSVFSLPQRLVELGPCLLESLLWKHPQSWGNGSSHVVSMKIPQTLLQAVKLCQASSWYLSGNCHFRAKRESLSRYADYPQWRELFESNKTHLYTKAYFLVATIGTRLQISVIREAPGARLEVLTSYFGLTPWHLQDSWPKEDLITFL